MTKQITRSVRLSEDEARALAEIAAEYNVSESALLARWVAVTLRAHRVERAAAAYRRDEVDLREAAVIAGMPIGVFVEELAERDVPLLRDPSLIEKEIEDLRAAFGPGAGEPEWAAAKPEREPAPARRPRSPRVRRAG